MVEQGFTKAAVMVMCKEYEAQIERLNAEITRLTAALGDRDPKREHKKLDAAVAALRRQAEDELSEFRVTGDRLRGAALYIEDERAERRYRDGHHDGYADAVADAKHRWRRYLKEHG